jgi:hypothetical protein
MRILTTGLLAIGLVIGGCNRGDMAIAKSAETPTAAPAGTTGATDATKTSEAANALTPATPAAAPAANAASEGWREVTIPAGTNLPIVLDTGIGSDISRIEAPVNAHLARAIIVDGRTVLAGGSRVRGVVTDATRSGKVKGRAHVAVRFDTLTPTGEDERYRIHTASVGRTAPATKKKDALTIGAPAAGGAVIGGLVGGKKGAAIGAAAGGGGGSAVVLSTRGKEVRMARGSRITLRLTQPLTVKLRAT